MVPRVRRRRLPPRRRSAWRAKKRTLGYRRGRRDRTRVLARCRRGSDRRPEAPAGDKEHTFAAHALVQQDVVPASNRHAERFCREVAPKRMRWAAAAAAAAAAAVAAAASRREHGSEVAQHRRGYQQRANVCPDGCRRAGLVSEVHVDTALCQRVFDATGGGGSLRGSGGGDSGGGGKRVVRVAFFPRPRIHRLHLDGVARHIADAERVVVLHVLDGVAQRVLRQQHRVVGVQRRAQSFHDGVDRVGYTGPVAALRGGSREVV